MGEVLGAVGGHHGAGVLAALDRAPETAHGVDIERLVGSSRSSRRGAPSSALASATCCSITHRAAVESLADNVLDLEFLDDVLDVLHRGSLAGVAQSGKKEQVRAPGQAQVEDLLGRERGAHHLLRRPAAGGVGADPGLSRRGGERSGDAPEQGGLAGSVWTEKGDPLTGSHGEIDGRQRELALELRVSPRAVRTAGTSGLVAAVVMDHDPELLMATGPDASSSELMVAVQAAIVDRATARVVTALREEGVRSILLKGPVLADWLYADSPRAYLDADLLVAPADVSRAEAVLDGLGYAKVLGDADIPPFNRQLHAHTWCPPRGTSIDLHRTLAGALATPATVWAVLSQDAVMAEVDGTGVEVLGPEARSVMVVLHAAHHGAGEHKPLEDLVTRSRGAGRPGLGSRRRTRRTTRRMRGIRRGTEDAPRRCGAGRRTRPAGALVGGGGASDRCAPPACPAHRMDARGTEA